MVMVAAVVRAPVVHAAVVHAPAMTPMADHHVMTAMVHAPAVTMMHGTGRSRPGGDRQRGHGDNQTLQQHDVFSPSRPLLPQGAAATGTGKGCACPRGKAMPQLSRSGGAPDTFDLPFQRYAKLLFHVGDHGFAQTLEVGGGRFAHIDQEVGVEF